MKRLGQSIIIVVLMVAVFIAVVTVGEQGEMRQAMLQAQATAVFAATRYDTYENEVSAARETAVFAETRLQDNNTTTSAMEATAQAQVVAAQMEAATAATRQAETAVQFEPYQQANYAYEMALSSHRLRQDTNGDIEESTLLAIEAVQRQPDTNTIDALSKSVELLPQFETKMSSTHQDANHLLFSADGRYLLSSFRYSHGYSPPGARLWDVASGEKISSDANVFAWSANGHYMVKQTANNNSIVYDALNQKLVLEIKTAFHWIRSSAAISPDSTLIAYSTSVMTQHGEDNEERESIFVIQNIVSDTEILHHVLAERGRQVVSYNIITFSDDGQYVAGVDLDLVDVWEISTGKMVAQFPLNVDWPEYASFSPDNNYLAIAGYDGVKLWHLAEDQDVPIDSLKGDLDSFRFSADGNQLLVARHEQWDAGEGGTWYTGQNGLQVWDVGTGMELLHLPHPYFDAAIPESNQLLTVNEANTAELWDIQTGKLLHQARLPNLRTAAISLEDGRIATLDKQNHIAIWSFDPFATEQILQPMTVYEDDYRSPDNLNGILYSPDGTTLTTYSWDWPIRFWDTTNGQEYKTIQATGIIRDVAYSSDGKYLAIAGGNYPHPSPEWEEVGYTKIWQEGAGMIITLTHDLWVKDVAFNLDGRFFATRTDDQIEVWETTTGEKTGTYALENPPSDFIFTHDYTHNPDGDYVVVDNHDGYLRVREVNGREINRLPYDENIEAFAFSPDGKQIAIQGRKTVYLWNWNPADWIVEACSRLSRNLTLDEWQAHFDSVPYHLTCPNLPDPTTR